MPVAEKENIFGALFKWGETKSKEEDFYSKSLVLILKRLQEYGDVGKELAATFLNSIFMNRIEFADDLRITDHVGHEHKPDIIIQDARNLAYIEVKIKAGSLGESNLPGYRDEVDEKAGDGKDPFLFGLTRYGNDEVPCGTDGVPIKIECQASWMSVWRHLKDIEMTLKTEIVDGNKAPEAYYLIRDYRNFLKENSMGIDKVTRQFSSIDLYELIRWAYLIKAGCKDAGLKLDVEATPRIDIGVDPDTNVPYIGWGFKHSIQPRKQKTGFWCGFFADNPNTLIFEIIDDPFDYCFKKLLERKQELDTRFPHWEKTELIRGEGYARFPKVLPNNFLSLNEGQQIEWINKFIEEVLTGVDLNTPKRRRA